MSAHVAQRPDRAAGASLVFTGAFNPVIFQPAWLMRYGLIPDDEESIELQVVSREITSWGQAWLKVLVRPERCEFHANDEVASYKALHDVASGVFALLSHTPIQAFGVNRFAHFQTESEDVWHELGFGLFTRERWEGVLDDPRMRSLAVESRRGTETDGVITATVQPSTLFKNAVFVSTNDHYQAEAEMSDAEEAMQRLAAVFDRSLAASGAIIERVRSM